VSISSRGHFTNIFSLEASLHLRNLPGSMDNTTDVTKSAPDSSEGSLSPAFSLSALLCSVCSSGMEATLGGARPDRCHDRCVGIRSRSGSGYSGRLAHQRRALQQGKFDSNWLQLVCFNNSLEVIFFIAFYVGLFHSKHENHTDYGLGPYLLFEAFLLCYPLSYYHEREPN
jgi:hypothetical protein